MGLAGERLESYMGSQHSAVGFLLALFGLIALGMGLFALGDPNDFPRWLAISLVTWGIVALPLGISMRRKRPAWPTWVLANLLLGMALLAGYGVTIFGR